jgi:FtsP/CotA-like multicopper oxidase with cupredoxin domain
MTPISRRAALSGGLAVGALGAAAVLGGANASSSLGWTEIGIEGRVLEVNGKPAKVFALVQPDGIAGLTMMAGDRFRVRLANRTDGQALIHWHGLTPPNALDGVPHVTQAPIVAGGTFDYDFAVDYAGTNWMHSHLGLQEQRLMAAPLIVRDPAEAHVDEQEVVVMLHDFSFRDPEEILSGLAKGMSNGAHSMPMSGAGMDHSMHAMDPMAGAGMNAMVMAQGQPMHDLNDVRYDAYLANDRTLGDPQIVRVERAGRVRLRIINAAASTNFTIDLGQIDGELIAVDGRPVLPLRGRLFPLAMAQRADIRLALPAVDGAYPILARREGDAAQTGIVLATKRASLAKVPTVSSEPMGAIDAALSLLPAAGDPLPPRAADRRFSIALTGDMMGYAWGLADLIDGAPNIAVKMDDRVEIELVNRTMMSHPMHLHGHHFQIVAVEGVRRNGAMRDTVLVPTGGRVTIAFEARNPGRWMFHCHNLYHMVRGMMSEVVYS